MKLLKFKDNDISQERIDSALRMLEDPDLEYVAADNILCALRNFISEIDDDRAFYIALQIDAIRGILEDIYADY